MTWSYDLLTTAEQALWRRSSVFTGSFDLDAAESVCSGDGIAADAIADLVDGLVAKSVLLRRPGGRTARYGLLDTIREYGKQRLREAGRDVLLRGRHRDWYAALAGSTSWTLTTTMCGQHSSSAWPSPARLKQGCG